MRDGVDLRACRRPGLLHPCNRRLLGDGIRLRRRVRGRYHVAVRHAVGAVSHWFPQCRVRDSAAA